MPDPEPVRLGQTGQIYVTLAAAQTYARYQGWQIEEARHDLTELLIHATASDAARAEDPERWRYRKQSERLDITARVARQNGLAVVVSLSCRDLRNRRTK